MAKQKDKVQNTEKEINLFLAAGLLSIAAGLIINGLFAGIAVITGIRSLLFMQNPGMYWNQAHISIKKRIQDSIFPEGFKYDCQGNFGITNLAEAYLLTQKIASKEAKNPNLVEYVHSNWNLISKELLRWNSINTRSMNFA